jgi:DNA-directed RNA polymerase specialized sigma24 family protein
MLQEQYDHLLSILNDKRLREIAIARVEGYTVPEIAARQEICTRAVERKLQIIRSKWAKQLSDVDEQ